MAKYEFKVTLANGDVAVAEPKDQAWKALPVSRKAQILRRASERFRAMYHSAMDEEANQGKEFKPF